MLLSDVDLNYVAVARFRGVMLQYRLNWCEKFCWQLKPASDAISFTNAPFASRA